MIAQSYTHPHRVYPPRKKKEKKNISNAQLSWPSRPPAQPHDVAPSRHTIIPPRHVTNRPLWQDKSYDIAIKTKFTQPSRQSSLSHIYKSKTWDSMSGFMVCIYLKFIIKDVINSRLLRLWRPVPGILLLRSPPSQKNASADRFMPFRLFGIQKIKEKIITPCQPGRSLLKKDC